MNANTTNPEAPEPTTPGGLSKDLERNMAVYSDTDMDPNRDDQKDEHHGASDEA